MAQDFTLHEEIRVARFWREIIGQYEYGNYDPDDLYRWYKALETRGPQDIRATINERATKYPVPRFLGLVSKPPHPPTELVMLWLETHELKTRTGPLWLGLGGFLMLSFLLGMGMQGCQHLHNLNQLALNPGQPAPPLLAPPAGTPPPATATLPGVPTPNQPSQGPSTLDGAPGVSMSVR
jgi:hypothetical protein